MDSLHVKFSSSTRFDTSDAKEGLAAAREAQTTEARAARYARPSFVLYPSAPLFPSPPTSCLCV